MDIVPSLTAIEDICILPSLDPCSSLEQPQATSNHARQYRVPSSTILEFVLQPTT